MGSRFPGLTLILVLIETSWNVKEDVQDKIKKFDIGINRNIVECKVQLFGVMQDVLIGINRNIVECKGITGRGWRSGSSVLIETSWNVKVVKLTNEDGLKGINRNIVECKVYTPEEPLHFLRRINRNIVECKELSPGWHICIFSY